MMRSALVLVVVLGTACIGPEAAAQQSPLAGGRIAANPATDAAPPPPNRGLCTVVAPCRGPLGDSFYYTASGDRRYVAKR